MPMRTDPKSGLEYALVCYDDEGHERREADGTLLSETLLRRVRDPNEAVTDVFVMSHGWKGDVPAAVEQYDRWSAAMATCDADRAAARARWPGFRPLLVGVHWPSLPWGDEKVGGSFGMDATGEAMGAAAGRAAEDAFVDDWAARIASTPAAKDALRVIYRSALEDIEPDRLPTDVADAYRTLEREAALGADGPAASPDADREPLDPQSAYEDWRDMEAASFGGGMMGGILSPLRQLSFWTMKKRARKVGERGGHELLKKLGAPRPGVGDGRPPRLHVMGHSFGCIVVSGMLRGEKGDGGVCVDSAILVQGAMSLWSYAKSLPEDGGKPGYFRPVLDRACVRGPVVVTTSSFDNAVGKLYPMAAGAARQTDFAGAALPKYGAIGTFGLQGAGVGAERREIASDLGHDYGFVPGHVYNVKCDSVIRAGGGLSGAHSDIAHPEVGHLFWGAVLAAPPG